MKRFAVVALLIAAGCRPTERADLELCGAILDRVVDLELTEMGVHDPVLAERRHAELRKQLQNELQRCVGRRAPATARACIGRAQSMTELTHECLAL